MKFNSRGGVSILELFIYLPSLVISAIICARHGFGRSSGWVFTLILCLIRILGACCQLATYHDRSHGLIETAIILDSVGLSPLLLATLGLLSRCSDSINQSASTMFSGIHFRVVQIVITVGLILSIVGGTSSISSTGTYKVQTSSKVGVILYVIAYIALAFMAGFCVLKLSYASNNERRLAWAVLIALPLIFIRLLYSLLSIFAHSHDFNLITGSVTVLVVMAVLEEFAVVFVYLFVGWKTDAIPAGASGPIVSRPWKGALNGGGARQAGRGMRQGPIHGLVGLALAAAQGSKQDEERGSI